MLLVSTASAQQRPRDQWGAMPVVVSHIGDKWLIKGKRNTVTLNQSNLTLSVQASLTTWNMVPSSTGDMIVRVQGEDVSLRIADAKNIKIDSYDTDRKSTRLNSSHRQ